MMPTITFSRDAGDTLWRVINDALLDLVVRITPVDGEPFDAQVVCLDTGERGDELLIGVKALGSTGELILVNARALHVY